MMGSVPQTGRVRTYWFEYEYIGNKGRWRKKMREFKTEKEANHAHLTITLRKHRNPENYRKLTHVSWRDTWVLPQVRGKQ